MTQLKQARTFGDWGYLALEKHYQKIIDRESAVLQNKDPEQLHQMRVGMRRLRSALSGFDLALDLPPTVEDKEISKIAKVLGQLRNLDVLQETLATQYQPLLPKTEQKILAEVIEILQKQRQKIFKQVKQVLNSDRYLNFKQDIQTWLDEPQYQNIASIAIERVLADLLLPQISSFLLHPGWLVGTHIVEAAIEVKTDLEPESVENILLARGDLLHDLRKLAKRSRYNLALFTDLYGDAYQAYLEKIKLVQEILGNIQDSFVLIAFIQETLENKQYQKLVVLNDTLQSTRYQQWQQFAEIQQWFWNSQHRKDFQNIILYPR